MITGASSGIGATYAQRLAARGYNLLLIARNEARLQQLAAELAACHGVQADLLCVDLEQHSGIEKAAERLRSDAQISLLVNCAGVALNGGLGEADLDSTHSLLQLNLLALTMLSSAAAVRFSLAGRGAIINIGALVALSPERGNAIYSASKAYVLNLSQSLCSELSGSGVQVQVVLPGITRTELLERAGSSLAHIPPSMVMEVEDLVDAALRGFDQGELVTIPSLQDSSEWQALTQARLQLAPNLSHNQPAARYS
ncbi:SDR family NAD(P)-dependent oxidoreductase [Halopseudomonas maritima]|uniref:SDR family NAD(P)-dependent oxidoreductase n=1 Tax=Halopseudomonas maritima TaxID=2918528 RepID=UPI001EECBC80|nr:SDR family NAD(P)-dependent oxidoreductase [Halopseudomonas maritima]UJJ33357.1 SDR family NAD(P)-dependent oxidoreductase [Halopseudomonas maritima]